MSALDKLIFSVAEELARGAKQAMPMSQWQKYLQPGRVLERGGVKFPLRKDEIEYGPLGQLMKDLDPKQAYEGSHIAQLLRDVGQDSHYPRFQRLDDESLQSMRYPNQYQLPGEKLDQAEELTRIPGLNYTSPHFDSQGENLLSWSRTTRRPVAGSEVIQPEYTEVTPNDISLKVEKDNPYSGQRDVRVFGPDGNTISFRSGTRDTDDQIREKAAEYFNKMNRPKPIPLKTAQHMEEAQSDLHQAGRDKGYAPPPEEIQAAQIENEVLRDDLIDSLVKDEGFIKSYGERSKKPVDLAVIRRMMETDGSGWSFGREMEKWGVSPENQAKYNKLKEVRERAFQLRHHQLPPKAPYKDTYHELELKKNIARAIEQGDEYVTWTTGEQQAERWGQALRGAVDEIHYVQNKDGTYSLKLNKDGHYVNIQEGNLENLKPDQLEDMVGKEMAEKIKTGEGKTPPLSVEEHEELNGLLRNRESILDRLRSLQTSIHDKQTEFRNFVLPPGGDPGRADALARRNDLLEKTAEEINENNRLFKQLESMRSSDRFNDLNTRYNRHSVGQGTISGDDIVVGGAGMRMNYDRKMVQAAEKLAKQYGMEGVTKIKLPGVDVNKTKRTHGAISRLATLDPAGSPNEVYRQYMSQEESIVDALSQLGENWDETPLGEAAQAIRSAFDLATETADKWRAGSVPHERVMEARRDYWETVKNFLIMFEGQKIPSGQEVWALRLSPEIKEKIKKAGLSMFAVPPVAAAVGASDSSAQEPRGYAKGGPVFKDYDDVAFEKNLDEWLAARHSSPEEQALAREYSHWPDLGGMPLPGPEADARQWDLPRDDWGDEGLAGMTPSQVFSIVDEIRREAEKDQAAREAATHNEYGKFIGESDPSRPISIYGKTFDVGRIGPGFAGAVDALDLLGIPTLVQYLTRTHDLPAVARGEKTDPWMDRETAKRVVEGDMGALTGSDVMAFGEAALNSPTPFVFAKMAARIPGAKKVAGAGLGSILLSQDRPEEEAEVPVAAGSSVAPPGPPTYVDRFNEWYDAQGFAQGGLAKMRGYAVGGSAMEKLPAPAQAVHQRLYDMALSAPEAASGEALDAEGAPVGPPSLQRTLDTVLADRAASSEQTGPTEAPMTLPIPGPVIAEAPPEDDSWFDDLINPIWSSDMSGLDPNARELIFRHEGMNQPYKFPGGVSGITLGRGYDLGHHTLEEFKRDWGPYLSPEQLEMLSQAVGKTGPEAQALAKKFVGIDIDENAAAEVFDKVSAPKYIELARRTFPGFDELPANAQGALVSLVYNRGGSLKGASRVDMREIHDIIKDGVQEGDLEKIAHKLRDMKRLWKNKGLDGLLRRRDEEAELIWPTKSAGSSGKPS